MKKRKKLKTKNKYWKPKIGKKLAIKELTNKHLLNIMSYLERKAQEYFEDMVPPSAVLTGDMALYHAEQEWDQLNSKTPEELAYDFYPIYESLQLEAINRGLL